MGCIYRDGCVYVSKRKTMKINPLSMFEFSFWLSVCVSVIYVQISIDVVSAK